MNSIHEVFSIFPNPFQQGKISYDEVPLQLKENPLLEIFISETFIGTIVKAILLIILLAICPLLLIIVLFFFAGGTLYAIIIRIIPESIIDKLFPKLLKEIYYIRQYIKEGLYEYNVDCNFELAKEKFLKARHILQTTGRVITFSKERPINPNIIAINEYIIKCMGYLEEYSKMYEFIQDNDVMYKRTKLLMLNAIINPCDVTIAFFENNYTEQEIKSHPIFLLLPLIAIAIYYKNPQKALEYINTKYEFIFKPFLTDELYILFYTEILLYRKLKNTDKEKELINYINNNENSLNYSVSKYIQDIEKMIQNADY